MSKITIEVTGRRTEEYEVVPETAEAICHLIQAINAIAPPFKVDVVDLRVGKARAHDFEELKEHVVEKLGLSDSDASWLWEHWEGNGWKVQGKAMKSWRMTASSWERLKYFPSQKEEQKGSLFSR